MSEWGNWDGEKYHLKGAEMVRVDGKEIKEDIWYTLENGIVVEKPDND